MSNGDIATLERIRRMVGRAFQFKLEGARCVELDLTSDDSIWHGLIRHHSLAEKSEILGLICKLTGLRRLNLRRNCVRILPEEFRDLAQLEELNLGSNELGSIPVQLRSMPQLRYLHLGNNGITWIPDFLAGLRCLEYLTLHKNIGIKSVDALAGLTQLKHLNLHYLNLHRLPAFIYQFRSLVTLTLWNVREFSDELENLTHLEFFSDCGAPGLRRLPDSFTRLRKLRMVRLFQNNLEELPEDFGNLEDLEQVSLYQNQLTKLPDSFARLQKLTKLNLAWNKFRTVPGCLSACGSLEWLAIFENPLKHAEPSSLPSRAKVLKTWPFTT